MNKRQTLLLLCLAMMNIAWAGHISQRQASAIATDFLSAKCPRVASMKMAYRGPALRTQTTTSDRAAYYVFNSLNEQDGYVIVAGDDRAPAVLAYSDQGCFDADQIPEAMQEWLEGITAQMEALDEGAQLASHLQARAPIAPLLRSTWSQNSPYYINMPFLPSGKHAAVGCVATAIAQVMYYWKWPARPSKTIPSYVSPEYSISMPSLSPIDFNWSAMQDTYRTDDTVSVAAKAVAKLSLYCAQSVEMDFQQSSSTAYTSSAIVAMINYFDYDPGMRHIVRNLTPTHEWEQLIYNELQARRPVIYRGAKENSGHMFVCDGYDGNGMFHINWGWNSSSNGYFLLNVLNPDLQGTGSATGSYGYVFNQSAYINVRPATSQARENAVSASDLELTGFVDTRSGLSNNFSATLNANFSNYSDQPISFNYGFGIYNANGELIATPYTNSTTDLPSWYYIYLNPPRTIYFGSGLPDGTYRIMPIYCAINWSNWKPCLGTDVNYIEVVINGNRCTFTGHGMAASPNYQVNAVNATGNMHPKRPIDITVNLTNKGNTCNDLIYMFVDGKFEAAAQAVLDKGETGDVTFRFTPQNAGSFRLTFSTDKEGGYTLASKTISVNVMPAANLSATVKALNVTDIENKVITSDKFSVQVRITNKSTTDAYNEDIAITLYKHIYGATGTSVQSMYKKVYIAPGLSTTVQFDLDNVVNGWKYFVKTYYYSSSEQVSLASSPFYTIIIPQEPQYERGDVNHDGAINIADLNAIISVIFSNGTVASKPSADVNYDGLINIADVNAMIGILLGQ